MTINIKTDKNNVNYISFEDLLLKANQALLTSTAHEKQDLRIDLSQAEFLDTYSIVNFCTLIRYLQKYLNISLAIPFNSNVTQYLKRINFFHYIPKEIKIHSNKSFFNPKNKVSMISDVLLEITQIKNQKDINNAIQHIIEKTGNILKIHLRFGPADLASFCTALAETCQNIKDHSEDTGLVAVQKYHSKINYAVIGISDLGIGIKNSLSFRYDMSGLSHKKAIAYSMRLGVSRLRDRGKGLHTVKEIVNKYKGQLLIRSGSGMISLGKNNFSSTVPYFPGTQIYIRLYEKN